MHLPLNSKFDMDFRPVVPLTQSEAEAKLREEETSIVPPIEFGVNHYDIARVPSNFPVEDDLIHGALTIPIKGGEDERKIMYWGVFDGHEGWEMSTKLRISLMEYVSNELRIAYQNSPGGAAQEAITKAIETAFEKLDDDVISAAEDVIKKGIPLPDALLYLSLSNAGSCAILGIYDPMSRLLRVACVGDSRAVLGRRTEEGTWETIALSEDQTLKNSSELARLLKEHPDEPEMIKDDLVLGMTITRGFGNGRWKYSTETQQLMKNNYFSRSPRDHSLTPPYMTAKPVVTLTEVQPGNDFMIIGSDGLWCEMSSEEAVMLVGKWVDKKANQHSGKEEVQKQSASSQQTGSHVSQGYKRPKAGITEESITIVDDNAATHLARNAFGGAHQEVLRGILTFQAPFARCVRDDLTVQVVFFGSRPTFPKE